ncbi:hypothetical protein GX411_08810, partial [Candidatus Fermentibacteria bacterium]|nr:hypothetical protein [Candidatus Fermentibacteria bacterium]
MPRAYPRCSFATDPQTVAVIDTGSNSVRMEIAELDAGGGIRILERVQKSIRLGHDTFRRGQLSQETIRALVNTFRSYRKLLDFYGVQR